MKKIFLLLFAVLFYCFVVNAQGIYCEDARAFCAGTITFPAGVNSGTAQVGPNYGCLGSQPNPAWYYFQVGTSGDLDITITSSPARDIDFALWGPFTSPTSPCTAQLTTENIRACSYSGAATEFANITGAVAGNYYILLITNYSNLATNISFSKTGTGTGTTNCEIVSDIAVSHLSCKTYTFTWSGTPAPDAVWSFNDGTTSPASGNSITHTFNANGSYWVSISGAIKPANVQVNDIASPEFTYSTSSPCNPASGLALNISNYNSQYNYTWNINGVSQGIDGPSGVYGGMQQGANIVKLIHGLGGCSSEVSKTINLGASDAIFNVSPNVCIGDVLSVNAVSSGGDTYAWTINKAGTGNVYSSANRIPSYAFASSGTYTVSLTITNNYSPGGPCTSTHSEVITVKATPNALFTLAGNTGTCNDEITLNLPVNSGGYSSYTLDYGDGTVLNGANYTAGNQASHPYTGNGIYKNSFTVVNGSCTSTYSQNAVIRNKVEATILASSANLCPGSTITLEGVVSDIPVNATNIIYTWSGPNSFSSSQQKITVSTPGTYSLHLTSGGTCPLNITKTKTITGLATPTANLISVPDITCSQSTGSATLEIPLALVQQGYCINNVCTPANPSASAPVQTSTSGLLAGDNYVIITNGIDKSCSGTVTVHLNQNVPQINLNIVQPANCGQLGSASAAPTGGSGINSVIWYPIANPSDVTTGNARNNLNPGTYAVELSNGNCKVKEFFSIVIPVINLSLLNKNPATCTQQVRVDVNAQFSPLAVTGTFNYVWRKIEQGGTVIITSGDALDHYPLSVGSYNVTVSSQNCTASLGFEVKPLPPLSVSFNTEVPKCKNDAASITALSSGGDGKYLYTWSIAGVAQNISTNADLNIAATALPATVQVFVTDASGCSATYPLVAQQINPATEIKLKNCGTSADLNSLTDDLTQAITTNACDLNICVGGGMAPYNFEWYVIGETRSMNERIFYWDAANAILKTKNAAGDLVVIPPASQAALDALNAAIPNLNSDGDLNTYYYPYWSFSPTAPILNSQGQAYSVKETIVNTTSEIFVNAHSGTTTNTGAFKTGHYKLYATDANGCKYNFDIGNLNFNSTLSTPAFDFVWALNPIEPVLVPENDKVDPILADNMAEAANEMLSEAQACISRQAEVFTTTLKRSCSDLSQFRDAFSIGYSITEDHYALSYYDRAGQLTKTVPPQGVKLLTEAQINEVKAYRKNIASPVPTIFAPLYVGHKMSSTYQYNSLGQRVSKTSPDGGTSNFIYDSKSRLRFSQNAQQALSSKYSYTKYDELGRTFEVGESSAAGLDFGNLNTTTNLTNADLETFPSIGNAQITSTVYSNAAGITYYGKPQKYLQNRISSVSIDHDPAQTGDEYYTYYSYDSHGNVEWLVQQDPELGKNYIAYEYDLISGKVLKVKYNENRSDRFFHQYSYDAENRLTKVETSRDGILWDRDAEYKYYAHGPLKRNELGEDKVQGLDYIYTIEGWLKSINTPHLNPNDDPGLDKGFPTANWQTGLVAQDRFGMLLNYYKGDYTRSGSFAYNSNTLDPLQNGNINLNNLYAQANNGATLADKLAPDLYNGNISHWVQSQLNQSLQVQDARADLFKHDVLNRLKQSTTKEQNGTLWDNMVNGANAFKTAYTYDANANLLNLSRYDETGAQMDNLAYTYDAAMGVAPLDKNRLLVLTEGSGVNTVDGRQDLEGTHTYTYDETGNLTADAGQERLNAGSGYNLYTVNKSMSWTVYGKVKEINTAIDPLGLNHKERIRYDYDASGNRTKKEVWRDASPYNGNQTPEEFTTTFYVRDAQGNILSVYEKTFLTTPELGAHYEYKKLAQPIYGSDRIGENVENVVLAASATAEGLVMPGEGISSISEYQNWITTTNKTQLLPGGTDQLCNCKVKSLSGTNYSTIGTAAEFLGVAENGIAVAENLQGELQFYVVLAKKYLGEKDVCLVYDKDGKLMKGTELIGGIDVNSKPIITNITGTNKYAITHLNNNKLPVYNVVDMDATGYGNLTPAGEVIGANQPMTTGTASHGWHFTAYEDHVAKRSIVYSTRYTANPAMPIKGKTEIVAYEFGTDVTQTPTEHILYEIEGCGSTETGELQISPKGDKLLWYQHDKNVSGFSHRLADIYTFELTTDKIAVTNNFTIVHSSQAGNYGNGMAEIMQNNEDMLYSQRGVYKEGNGVAKYEKNVWKYVKATSAVTSINPFTNPAITYLFSEIKRGVDGNYYMPNMGELADKIHSYSGTEFNANVNLGEAGHELASSLPTQVYKVFVDPAQVPAENKRQIGKKEYELTNPITGNVHVVVSDRKLAVDSDDNGTIDYMTADVLAYYNYYGGVGQLMPGLIYEATDYRYGAQGSEVVKEINGTRDHITTFYREGDLQRLQWWTPDPKQDASESPYVMNHNNGVRYSDPMGDQPPYEFGAKAKLSIGIGGGRPYFNVGVTGSVSQRFNFVQPTLDVSANAYNGGLGTSGNSPATQFDISAAAHVTAGGGSGMGMPQYTMNYNTQSAIDNTFAGSGTYGQILNYNSGTDQLTRQGFVGARGGNFSFASNNDTKLFPYGGYGTDQGWTGGIILSGNIGGNLFETGYQSFTGTHFGKNSQPRSKEDLYYQQSPFQQSLNKASTFGRVNGLGVDNYGEGWLQNYIHNSKSLKLFQYDYRDTHATTPAAGN